MEKRYRRVLLLNCPALIQLFLDLKCCKTSLWQGRTGENGVDGETGEKGDLGLQGQKGDKV